MGTMTRAGGQTHFNKTKHGMNKMREEQTRLLQRLSLQAESCQKVVPFYPTLLMTDEGEEEALGDEALEMREEFASLAAYARSQTGKTVDRWNMLDNFLRKYNSVLLDKEAIKREEGRLQQENADLRSILKQYLDGISVNNNVLAGPNPLMVVNERSNIQTQPPAVATSGPTNIIEGNVSVNQQYYPAPAF